MFFTRRPKLTAAFFDYLLGFYPKTAAESFGVAAVFAHLVGYYYYGKHVLSGKTQPNLAAWGMWLFGAIVELVTYDAIEGSHWSTNALPVACACGVLGVSSTIAWRILHKVPGKTYVKPELSDYGFVVFDVGALSAWLTGLVTAGVANFFSVSTTVVQFLPMYRETAKDPTLEKVGPWIWWCVAYTLMLLAVATGTGSWNWWLYFLPGYYLALHLVMVPLCLRRPTKPSKKEHTQRPTRARAL